METIPSFPPILLDGSRSPISQDNSINYCLINGWPAHPKSNLWKQNASALNIFFDTSPIKNMDAVAKFYSLFIAVSFAQNLIISHLPSIWPHNPLFKSLIPFTQRPSNLLQVPFTQVQLSAWMLRRLNPLQIFEKPKLTVFLFPSAQFTQLSIFDHLFNPHEISKFHNQEKRDIWLFFEEKLNSHPKYISLSSIFTSTPPWLYAKPSIRYDLTSIPKSHNASLFLSELHFILQEYPDHTHCYIDGSHINHKTSCAYSVAGSIHSFPLYNSSSIFTAELVAILSCIQSLSHNPASNFLILTDPLSSLKTFENLFSAHPLVQRILLSLHTLTTCNISLTSK